MCSCSAGSPLLSRSLVETREPDQSSYSSSTHSQVANFVVTTILWWSVWYLSKTYYDYLQLISEWISACLGTFSKICDSSAARATMTTSAYLFEGCHYRENFWVFCNLHQQTLKCPPSISSFKFNAQAEIRICLAQAAISSGPLDMISKSISTLWLTLLYLHLCTYKTYAFNSCIYKNFNVSLIYL